MKRGKYTKKGYDIRCVPNTRDRYGSLTAKKNEGVKLVDIFASKKNRGNSRGLYTIKDKDRFKGRNWVGDRPEIKKLIEVGMSVSEIARRLGVTPSALSKANKRHNLYPPKQAPC
ncbi:helix-turn-helix domain-containing protein [candidate division KSB1 bacterium]|nr:helix-turn-helix domain-containing protein [candidate division KSB1 bacterium]